MKKLKVVEVLQYNGVNMKVIRTKRTTVKMGLLYYNTPVVWLQFWVHELLMSLKSRASGEVPRASKIWGLLAQRARWNSNIFRALTMTIIIICTIQPQLLLGIFFTKTVATKQSHRERKVNYVKVLGFSDFHPHCARRPVSHMNSVKWPRSPQVLVAQQVERPPSVWEVMGSIPVGDSDFFHVPCLCHVDQFFFHMY